MEFYLKMAAEMQLDRIRNQKRKSKDNEEEAKKNKAEWLTDDLAGGHQPYKINSPELTYSAAKSKRLLFIIFVQRFSSSRKNRCRMIVAVVDRKFSIFLLSS